MATAQTKLSRNEKQQIANRINYFRTMPSQIRNTAGDLDGTVKSFQSDIVTHELKSVVVAGRVMLLNCSN